MRSKLLSILVLSILVTSTLVSCGSTSSTLTILSITEGNVSVMKAGTGNWIEAQVGMSLEVGDSIKTGNSSSAEITFFDGSTIELQAGTEIEIASLDISTDTGSTTITLEQTIGNTISRVTKILDPASRYEVETPTGVVAVRGSATQVYVIEDGTTWAINLEGDIWAVAQGVEIQIPEGRQCIVRPGQPPELIDLYFETDAYLGLNGPATLPLEERDPCVILGIMTSMVVDSVRVEPIPGARNTDIWVGVEAPDPPCDLTAEVIGDGILVSWDESPTIPGSFEPAAEPQLGFYQLGISRIDTDELVYGANFISASPHLIPRSKADFVEGTDHGLSLSEMADGRYYLGASVLSVAPTGSLGNALEYNSTDADQGTIFTIQNGEITIG